ncbi:WXG100 family type VII secretion target [Nonomuraea lactucae]|uniref:WXG100 family type VII secretion target n=1 Tax=Nonomuraea lactucae TaxID=2249762 RepID=UPI0023DD50B6|nr:WXG100 family type VII secretion target [Nonomuraea lactucae]
MSLFGASPTQLQNAARFVEAAAQNIEGLRKGVATTVQELTASGVASGWEGAAAVKYKQHMDNWDMICKRIIQDLEKIYDNLNVGAGVYGRAEADSHNIGLGGIDADTNKVDELINVRA